MGKENSSGSQTGNFFENDIELWVDEQSSKKWKKVYLLTPYSVACRGDNFWKIKPPLQWNYADQWSNSTTWQCSSCFFFQYLVNHNITFQKITILLPAKTNNSPYNLFWELFVHFIGTTLVIFNGNQLKHCLKEAKFRTYLFG